MTDRELLEAAAKAAGIKALHDPHGVLRDCTGLEPAMNIFAAPAWNPLTDDGDALRLAVKCRIDLISTAGHVSATSTAWDGSEHWANYEDPSPDPYAATRRAIVRAAAAMVKA